MSKFKHPQYLTANGLIRMETRPRDKAALQDAKEDTTDSVKSIIKTASPEKKQAPKPSRLRLLAEKKVMAKRIQERKEKGISEEAAKVLAEAIKTMLHS